MLDYCNLTIGKGHAWSEVKVKGQIHTFYNLALDVGLLYSLTIHICLLGHQKVRGQAQKVRGQGQRSILHFFYILAIDVGLL